MVAKGKWSPWYKMAEKMSWENLKEFTEGLIDEDERDEDGEDFLSESGDISDQEAAFQGHHNNHYHYQPHPHPDTTHNVVDVLGLAELLWNEKSRY